MKCVPDFSDPLVTGYLCSLCFVIAFSFLLLQYGVGAYGFVFVFNNRFLLQKKETPVNLMFCTSGGYDRYG